MESVIYKEESYEIIGACLSVHKILGNGFLESVYQEALAYELKEKGIPFHMEKDLQINYKGYFLKKRFIADFVCFDKIILELKATSSLAPEHESQVLNYLKATGFKLGILVNFGTQSMKYKRIVL